MINQTKPIHMQWPFAIDSIQDNIAWSSPGLWMDAWRQVKLQKQFQTSTMIL